MKLFRFARKKAKNHFSNVRLTEEILLSLAPHVRIRLHTHKVKGHGRVVKYVYQLETFFEGKWRFVVRYNNFHGIIHKDKFNPKGERISREYFEGTTITQAMKIADKDIKKNFEIYVKEFTNYGEANE